MQITTCLNRWLEIIQAIKHECAFCFAFLPHQLETGTSKQEICWHRITSFLLPNHLINLPVWFPSMFHPHKILNRIRIGCFAPLMLFTFNSAKLMFMFRCYSFNVLKLSWCLIRTSVINISKVSFALTPSIQNSLPHLIPVKHCNRKENIFILYKYHPQ